MPNVDLSLSTQGLWIKIQLGNAKLFPVVVGNREEGGVGGCGGHVDEGRDGAGRRGGGCGAGRRGSSGRRGGGPWTRPRRRNKR